MSFESELRLQLEGVTVADLTPAACFRLEALDRLLRHWSARLDLIGFKTEEDRLRRYFAEPLAASPELPRTGSGLDIGSGGGSPGLPFAILRPELSWTLLEPRLRRRLFLEEASRELGLGNVRVREERFSRTPRSGRGSGFEAISTRGVRLSRPEVESALGSLSPGGRFLWLSGADRLEEATEWIAHRPGLRVDGPRALLPRSEARLLLVERRA